MHAGEKVNELLKCNDGGGENLLLPVVERSVQHRRSGRPIRGAEKGMHTCDEAKKTREDLRT